MSTPEVTKLEPTTILRAGGLVPTNAKIASDVRAGTVAARRYAHPAIPGKTVVRIVPDAMAPGADIEMETLGFAKGEVSAALGKGRLRALGFPGWALINDPARASFALEVMKDFKKAAKQIRSKPGHARDAFVEIGKRLARSVPHFLPSFWEEAGRRFLLEESTTFAAQAFEKARSAEKEHALEVDEDTRSAAYLEFALAGAVAAKSLTGYAKELEEAYGPEKAYARYLELATRRVLGGMPPWTGLAKELRGLAKAAKKSLDAEDEAFLAAVIDAPAIARAPGEMWTTYDAALVRLAKKSPALQRRLRHLFPHPSSQAKDFNAWWFALLERAGALEGLWEPTEGEPELAEWLTKMIAYVKASPDLYALLPKLAPRLLREGKPVNPIARIGNRSGLSVDFTETLLGLGVGIVAPRGWTSFGLTDPMTVDPVLIQADKVLGPVLLRAVEGVLGTPEFEAAAKGKVGLERARRAWLEREVAKLSGGGVFSFGQACFRLAAKVRPGLWAEHPDLVAAVEAASVAEALARTLRGGVFAEWTWPAFEKLHAEKKKADKIMLTGAWPYPVFHDGIKARVLGADGVVFEHDFVLPPKAHVNRCLFVDGDLFVLINVLGVGLRAYWASSAHDLFEHEGMYWHELPTGIALDDGAVTTGARAIHRGDREIKSGYSANGDGTGVWIQGQDDGRFKLYELEPKTGAKGRASWPTFMNDAVAAEERDGLRIIAASFAPAPAGVAASPLGQKDGIVGIVVRGKSGHEAGPRQMIRVDGKRWEREGVEHPRALVSWPGDTAVRAVFGRYVPKPNGGSSSETQVETSDGIVVASLAQDNVDLTGWPAMPPLSLWCYLRPRDEAASKALRALDAATAERLLASAADVKSVLPISASALGDAVTAIVGRAVELRADVAKLATVTAESSGEANLEVVGDREATVPLGIFFKNRWAGGTLSEDVVALSDMVLGKPRKDFSISHVDWDRFIGRLRGLAVMAMLPGADPKRRATIAKLLRIFARTVFAAGKHTMRVFRGTLGHKSPLRRTEAQGWVATHAGSTYALRSTDAGDDEGDTDDWDITAIELRSDGGAFQAPPGVTISEERTVAAADDTAWLGAFDAVATKEPPAWDPAAAETFAAATGLTRAAATLILAGIPNIEDYDADFLGKELREKLGLKTTDAKVARESVRALAREKILEAYVRSAPDDPKDLLEPWSKSGFAARLAGAFAEIFGMSVTIREDVLAAFKRDLDPPLAAGLLELVATEQPVAEARLLSLPSMIAWLYLALPAGDPYRDAVPGLLARIDRMLADPKLVLPLRKFDVPPAEVSALTSLLDTIRGEPTTMKKGPEMAERAVDGGSFIYGSFKGGERVFVEFRPSQIRPDDPIGRAIATSPLTSWGDTTWAWKRVAQLRSPGLRALVDRIANGKLEAGAYEANPAASAPDVVAKVAKATKLSADAACHYLQLLALPEPTAKAVQLWNGWKPAQYKKTCDELLAKKLVVSGKRERAGREVFLPGAWEKKASEKGLPMEGWKKDLHPTSAASDRILPDRPLPQIFADAWKRIEAGDIPKLEEV